jgi:hypothetical protein
VRVLGLAAAQAAAGQQAQGIAIEPLHDAA